jgi:hypothetical protein
LKKGLILAVLLLFITSLIGYLAFNTSKIEDSQNELINTENKVENETVFANNNGPTDKEIITSSESVDVNQVVIDYAIEGIKAFREVNYQDPDYEGYKDPEIFAIGFRNSQIIGKAEERLKEVKEKKVVRELSDIKAIKVEITDDIAVIDFEVTEIGSEMGESKTQIYKSKVTLKENEDIWLIYGIQLRMPTGEPR